MLNPIWTAAASFTAVTAAALVGLSLATPSERATQRRLEAIAHAEATITPPRSRLLEQPFFQRAVLPGLQAFAALGERLTPGSQKARMITRLQQAGIYSPYGVQALLAFKAVMIVIAGLALWLVAHLNAGAGLMSGAALALLGVMGPEQWIAGRIRQRKDALVRSLPDTLDQVTSSVE
ncbi:MAG TPA: hypothetical protein V6D05_09770, partial [Stenomitos sp.]